MPEQRTAYILRPGKYIEYDFPLREVNRLAQKEAPVGGRRPIYFLHKWWARRLSCVFRTIPNYFSFSPNSYGGPANEGSNSTARR